MSEQKQCKQCGVDFTVADEDLGFYKKMSPTFDGKAFEMPTPTKCPDCRQQDRFASRNVTKLYKRRCDLCNKDIVTMYSPDKKLTVYCQNCWWSDKWSSTDFGQDFDPSKPFFEQFAELKKKVPKVSLVNVKSENSEFTNLADGNRNCYLLFLAGNDEEICYGYFIDHCRSGVDISFGDFGELCYESINFGRCYNINWCINTGDCKNSYFIEDCHNCSDCILCSNLNSKQYCYKNKQLSKEEYVKVKDEFLAGLESNLDKYWQEFNRVILSQPKKYAQILRSENCTGHDIYDSKNCFRSFMMTKCEDCKYCYGMFSTTDSYDVAGFGNTGELLYQGSNIGLGSARTCFATFAYQLTDSYYCDNCYNSKDLFGCAGVKDHRQYCILNKQYSKEEFEKKVAEIIEHMQKTGEWGEWFSPEISDFGYNETIANDYYPLSKQEAQELGYKWQDDDFALKFDGPFYEPLPINEYAKDETKQQELLKGVLKCEKTSRPYKIIPQELVYYIKNGIPIPKKHYETRFEERFNRMKHIKLYSRQCMCEEEGHDHQGRCTEKFESTYSENDPETVYCQECYWDKEEGIVKE